MIIDTDEISVDALNCIVNLLYLKFSIDENDEFNYTNLDDIKKFNL